ncbi:hypothetical protein [Amycolatopsis sp. NPDC051128]|uniref:hypothetical protein n=1 Tax=Amycolatopsis sp. NPDC051128 TaxID=3155412 RepID=UPI0034428C27
MIDQQSSGSRARNAALRFRPGQTVIGRRWGAEDLVIGAYIEHWGTGATAVLLEQADGERVSIVADTARPMETGARHRLLGDDQAAVPEPVRVEVPADLLPLPPARDEAPTELIAAVPEVEQDVPARLAPSWPDSGDLVAVETTEVFGAVDVVDEIGPDYAAGLADAIVFGIDGEDADPAWVLDRLRPSLRERLLTPWYWLVSFVTWLVDEVAMTVRWSARWELEHDRTIARLVLGGLSFVVLAGTGVVFLLWQVGR